MAVFLFCTKCYVSFISVLTILCYNIISMLSSMELVDDGDGTMIETDDGKMYEIEDLIIERRIIPERRGNYAPFPSGLSEDIKNYLEGRGIKELYIHQAETFQRSLEGENVVITTATASGKTLSFLLPVLQRILENPASRAIFVYPTKALASDQLRAINEVIASIGEGKVSAGVYDGDTLPAERTRIRKSANIILTNPEMLNSAFLPNHSKYGFDLIFANLDYIVVDELHTYRGAFGAHLANVFRRMKRVCGYYKSAPHFLCSSATVANPLELAEKVCGVEFSLVSEDGSPAPQKEYVILQPPAIKGKNDMVYGRIRATAVATDLLTRLVVQAKTFIGFTKSRRNVEVLLKECRDRLKDGGLLGEQQAEQVAGYRGGYTPKERKAIEQAMTQGKLTGLISTNALELGIDIGKLDYTALVGYPGTKASFWQQTGRAGRGGNNATNYLILENEPFDQYIAIDPDWLFKTESENAIVDPNNLLIELAHIRAAAAEMPLSLDDAALFPDLGEVLPVLLKAQEVRSLAGRFAWDGPSFPAGDYSMRNMDSSRYTLVNEAEHGAHITEMDESQAFRELYPGAIYMHDGEQYEVLSLDRTAHMAVAKPFEGNYYTVPSHNLLTKILHEHENCEVGRVKVSYGDINVDEIVSLFKKMQFHSHQNLGYVTLQEPLEKAYDTESAWITLPWNVVEEFWHHLVRYDNSGYVRNNHFEGMAHAIKQAAMMVTMTEHSDINVVESNNATMPNLSPDVEYFIYIYDCYEGGLGYSEKIYELMPQVLDQAIRLVRGCTCENGCPACVGNYTLDKKLVQWGLENLYEETVAPKSAKRYVEPERPKVEKRFSFFKLKEEWREFCTYVDKQGDRGGQFLSQVPEVEVVEHKLVLTVNTEFMQSWIMEPNNYRELLNTISYHATCPGDMSLEAVVKKDEKASARKQNRLGRHFAD